MGSNNGDGAGKAGQGVKAPSGENGVAARRLAIEAIERIEKDGAYANLLLPTLLAESD